MNLQDIIILSAMGPPDGGRSAITNRFTRHSNLIAYTELPENIIKQIFTSLVGFFLGT
jgi:dynein heavy chain